MLRTPVEEPTGHKKSFPFGDWGIFTGLTPEQLHQQNDDGELPVNLIPIKSRDPGQTQNIRLNGIDLAHKYEGRFSITSKLRGKRPVGPVQDVLQQVIDGSDYSIPVASDSGYLENPFSIDPIKTDMRDSAGVCIVNRYPSFARVIDPRLKEETEKTILQGSEYRKIAEGVCLVALPTESSDQLEDTDVDKIKAMLLALQKGLVYTTATARERGVEQQVMYVFINTKRETGRSLDRLHSQAIIDQTQDGHSVVLETSLQAYEKNRRKNGCTFCRCETELPKERILYKNGSFILYVPTCPEGEFDLEFAPREHREDMLYADAGFVKDLADILHVGSLGLTKAAQKDPRLPLSKDGQTTGRYVFVYQRPVGYDGCQFHMNGRIIPNNIGGGFEAMEICRITKYTPEDVGRILKPHFN